MCNIFEAQFQLRLTLKSSRPVYSHLRMLLKTKTPNGMQVAVFGLIIGCIVAYSPLPYRQQVEYNFFMRRCA